jgi:hypothetical protein
MMLYCALFSLTSFYCPPQLETTTAINLGACDIFALMASSTATCAGGPNCPIGGGKRGVWPGTSITGNFVGDTATRSEEEACAADRITALAYGVGLGAGTPVNMAAEMGGLTFGPGVHSFGSGLNIALLPNPTVYLDAQGDPDAVFIFYAGSTLTTCANSDIELLNEAKADNVFWVLGSALTMGADSILRGNVLAQSAITIGTNGIIVGRAMAHSAVTCETHCCVGLPTDFDDVCGAATLTATTAPTANPTKAPTNAPINAPTNAPINAPTNAPTNAPIDAPTNAPWTQCDCSGGDGAYTCRDIHFTEVLSPDQR